MSDLPKPSVTGGRAWHKESNTLALQAVPLPGNGAGDSPAGPPHPGCWVDSREVNRTSGTLCRGPSSPLGRSVTWKVSQKRPGPSPGLQTGTRACSSCQRPRMRVWNRGPGIPVQLSPLQATPSSRRQGGQPPSRTVGTWRLPRLRDALRGRPEGLSVIPAPVTRDLSTRGFPHAAVSSPVWWAAPTSPTVRAGATRFCEPLRAVGTCAVIFNLF